MFCPINTAILDRLRSGARFSGAADADLDGVVKARPDWARLPLFQIRLLVPKLDLNRTPKRQVDAAMAELDAGERGAEQRLREVLIRVA
jgi:hypothetical protein